MEINETCETCSDTKSRQDEETRGLSHFFQNVLFSGAGSSVSVLFLFFETLIAVRLVSPEDYGVYVLLIAVAHFFMMAVDWGSRTGVTQMMAGQERTRQGELASTALLFRLFAIGVVSALLWMGLGRSILALFDASSRLVQYTAWIPCLLLAASMDELAASMLQGTQNYRHMAGAQVLRAVLRLGLTVTLLWGFDLGLWALVYSWVLSFALSTLYQLWALPLPKRLSWRRGSLSELLRFGLPLQMNRFLWFLFGQVDIFLLGLLAGPASVAAYAVADKIPSVLHKFVQAYIAVYFPTTAKLLAEGETDQASQVLNQSLRLVSLLTALVALVVVLWSHEIMTLLFSDKYAGLDTVLALLMIGFHMIFILNVMGYTLTAAGHPRRSLTENLIRTTLTIIGDLILIPLFGVMGAVYAILAAGYATNPLSVWLLRKSGIRVEVGPYVKQTLLLLIAAGLSLLSPMAGVSSKIAVLVFFIGANIVLATVSRDDLRWLLPVTAPLR